MNNVVETVLLLASVPFLFITALTIACTLSHKFSRTPFKGFGLFLTLTLLLLSGLISTGGGIMIVARADHAENILHGFAYLTIPAWLLLPATMINSIKKHGIWHAPVPLSVIIKRLLLSYTLFLTPLALFTAYHIETYVQIPITGNDGSSISVSINQIPGLIVAGTYLISLILLTSALITVIRGWKSMDNEKSEWQHKLSRHALIKTIASISIAILLIFLFIIGGALIGELLSTLWRGIITPLLMGTIFSLPACLMFYFKKHNVYHSSVPEKALLRKLIIAWILSIGPTASEITIKEIYYPIEQRLEQEHREKMKNIKFNVI
ncbi:MAG: hypothetical protein R3E13_04590 [Alphaproteobacteria bacterium]